MYRDPPQLPGPAAGCAQPMGTTRRRLEGVKRVPLGNLLTEVLPAILLVVSFLVQRAWVLKNTVYNFLNFPFSLPSSLGEGWPSTVAQTRVSSFIVSFPTTAHICLKSSFIKFFLVIPT